MTDVVNDVVVVGGGIVGLAVAKAVLDARPGTSVVLVEKEDRVAGHQSSHNSGVLHSGIYYRPGSLKAQTVAAGRAAMVDFCAAHDVPIDMCGKVVVATSPKELERLDILETRGRANGVELTRITPQRLRELEPHAVGLAALHVPRVGVLDYARVCHALADVITGAGATIQLGSAVSGLSEGDKSVLVESADGARCAGRVVVNCGGLESDRVAQLHGEGRADVRIVPFRGEYYELVPHRRHLARGLVYPVPDPAFPFLGVHLTKMVGGGVHAGPNAVLALAREGYTWRDVDRRDLIEMLTFPGTWRMARRHWPTGMGEMLRSLSRRAFVRGLRRLVPEINGEDLVPSAAGVRAQAVSRSGALLDDFVLRQSARVVDVVNAPSPAATASLEIGRIVAQTVTERLAS